jgi:hypothetical protein
MTVNSPLMILDHFPGGGRKVEAPDWGRLIGLIVRMQPFDNLLTKLLLRNADFSNNVSFFNAFT